MGGEFVLRIRDRDELPGDRAPIEIVPYTNDGDVVVYGTAIASHDTGFDTSALVVDGEEVALSECCTDPFLRKRPTVEAVGRELWRRLTPGDMAAALAAHWNERIHLDLQSPSLWAYPWEMLRFDDETPFASAGAAWSLGSPELVPARSPVELGHPLRVLVLVGDRPDDTIAGQPEVAAIEALANERLTDIIVKTIERSENHEITAVIDSFKPHVFHFIGHGVDEAGPQFLVYQDRQRSTKWSAQRVRDMFSRHAPRLAVINACYVSGGASDAGSLIDAFTDRGTRAVLGMTHEILGPAAAEYSRTFYRQLLAGRSVDVAACEARMALRVAPALLQGENADKAEASWPLPRLVMRGIADRIVPLPPVAEPEVLRDPHAMARMPVSDFIGRWDQRYAAVEAIQLGKKVAFLTGPAKSGRSELLLCVAAICAREDDVVVPVALPENEGGDWRTMLAAIASAAGAVLPDHAAELEAFRDAIAAGHGPDDQRLKLTADLLGILDGADTPRRKLLAIDGLTDHWSSHLLADSLGDLCKVVIRQLEHTRLIVALPDRIDGARLGFSPGAWAPIEVNQFRAEEWSRGLPCFIKAQTEDADTRRTIGEMIGQLEPAYGRTAALLEVGRQIGKLKPQP